MSQNLENIFEQIRSGELASNEAQNAIEKHYFSSEDGQCIDKQRASRCGFHEVVYGESKSIQQCLNAAKSIYENSGQVLVTRIDQEKADCLIAELGGQYNELARCFYAGTTSPIQGFVSICCAGTSDMNVAEEARETLQAMGIKSQIIADVGVAGIHRLLRVQGELRDCDAVIAIAGMEGALPSVIGGLTDKPIIAVPTSVGYGTARDGFTALYAMLTSCASGISVVNIDNGFGAAYACLRILRGKYPQ